MIPMDKAPLEAVYAALVTRNGVAQGTLLYRYKELRDLNHLDQATHKEGISALRGTMVAAPATIPRYPLFMLAIIIRPQDLHKGLNYSVSVGSVDGHLGRGSALKGQRRCHPSWRRRAADSWS
jgi:hypothetical protein